MSLRALIALCLIACGDNRQPPVEPIEPIVRCDTPIFGKTVAMHLIAQVPNPAMLVTSPPNDGRLFVVEQIGAIRVIENDVVFADPFLDLSADAGGPVAAGGEAGLLGLAFHPQYASNGLFFVTYTVAVPGHGLLDVLARCGVSASDPNRADPASCVDVISIPDFASNHNGGMIEFGPDGYLYWATGDGGVSNDPNGNAQSLEDGALTPRSVALLGKMLRIDVDDRSGGEYGIPSDNPFVGGGGKPEIFMWGLRNPWRWSFDRLTGDMWIADVGQGMVEEVTVLRPNQQKGANLGWPVYEGRLCFNSGSFSDCTLEAVMPQVERFHSERWTSVTGGQVYRGGCFPDLVGTYFFTDYDDVGRLAAATLHDDDTVTFVDLVGPFPTLSASLHEDAAGELYMTDTRGNVFRMVVVGP